MTEAEWLACSNPNWLLEPTEHIFPTRKVTLWACASCRRVWHLLPDAHREVLEAVEASCERADYLVGTVDEDLQSRVSLPGWGLDPSIPQERRAVRWLATGAYKLAVEGAATALARESFGSVPRRNQTELQSRYQVIWRDEQAFHAVLARDVVGNPFCPVTFDPAWSTSTVVAIAKGMYDSRDFSAMPILADALQDAGCENEDVLTHCRDEQHPHVRGCWVVDLVLGKE
jgi:hypothetical protein